MPNKPHLFLRNPSGQTSYFFAGRGMDPSTVPDRDPAAYRPQKNKLNQKLTTFVQSRENRLQNRTLDIPAHLEYLEIHFFIIFNDSPPFNTKTRFRQFGLTPVFSRNFGQSIVFAISDLNNFQGFVHLLNAFIQSADNISPKGTPYAIATTIYDFEFLSTPKIMGFVSEDVVISLLNSNPSVQPIYENIYGALIGHLEQLNQTNEISSFTTDAYSTIGIKGISQQSLISLADNFDIIYKIQSLRTPTIKVNEFNVGHLDWNLNVQPPEKDVVIGVLDNGVRKIGPLSQIVLDSALDITDFANPDATRTTRSHGTVVASLAALGTSFFGGENNLVADAYILPIKILNANDGSFNIYDIERVIIAAAEQGVKIFNLSVCGPIIFYNSMVSEYAFLLDKLAFRFDILIFVAAGNLDEDDINAMNQPGDNNQFHRYPNHFYNPKEESEHHMCELTNICVPGESYNNITVGAIAENLNTDDLHGAHLTPFKNLPAYYTRKHYINVLAKINGVNMRASQKNRNINKPDIVMPGGDRMNMRSGMQVLGLADVGDFYNYDSGTSLASPLAANLAAKILGNYNGLTMQSVKSLILNSATLTGDPSLLTDLETKLKEEESQERFGQAMSGLDKNQLKVLNGLFSKESIYKTLIGQGIPNSEKILHSDDKSVTIVVQDVIAVKSYKVMHLNIPAYLMNYSKSSYILNVEATLCYKFNPVWGNQLAYNPLHISFNLANSTIADNPELASRFLSNTDDEYFNTFYSEAMDTKAKTVARAKALGIKGKLGPWSEDFYPPSTKPFSNVQSLQLKINKEEIAKVNNQICLAIRCTYKQDVPNEVLHYLIDNEHHFSISLRISEKANDELKEFSLYDELVACNDLQIITALEAEGDIDVDVEN